MKRRKLNPVGESFETTQTAKTTTRGTFNDLSVEMWHEIGASLEPSDKAALALTCKSSLACFGANVLRTLNLPSRRVERLKLLFRLYEHFPQHYLCPECCIYHLKSNQTKYEPADMVLGIFGADYTLKWSVMSKLADDLRKAKCTPKDAAKKLELGLGVSIALIDDHLFLDIACKLPLTVAVQQLGTYKYFRTCEHVPTSSSLIKDVERAIATAPRPWELQQAYEYKGPVFRCPYCPSEFWWFSLPLDKEELVPETGARFKLVYSRTISLGLLHSRHDREWAALTRPRYAGIVEPTPYDIGDKAAITKHYYTFKNWAIPKEASVLPLLD